MAAPPRRAAPAPPGSAPKPPGGGGSSGSAMGETQPIIMQYAGPLASRLGAAIKGTGKAMSDLTQPPAKSTSSSSSSTSYSSPKSKPKPKPAPKSKKSPPPSPGSSILKPSLLKKKKGPTSPPKSSGPGLPPPPPDEAIAASKGKSSSSGSGPNFGWTPRQASIKPRTTVTEKTSTVKAARLGRGRPIKSRKRSASDVSQTLVSPRSMKKSPWGRPASPASKPKPKPMAAPPQPVTASRWGGFGSKRSSKKSDTLLTSASTAKPATIPPKSSSSRSLRSSVASRPSGGPPPLPPGSGPSGKSKGPPPAPRPMRAKKTMNPMAHKKASPSADISSSVKMLSTGGMSGRTDVDLSVRVGQGREIAFMGGALGSGAVSDTVGTLFVLPSKSSVGWISAKSGMYRIELSANRDLPDRAKSGSSRLKEGSPCMFDSKDGRTAVNIREIERLTPEELALCMIEINLASTGTFGKEKRTLSSGKFFVKDTKLEFTEMRRGSSATASSSSITHYISGVKDSSKLPDVEESAVKAVNAFVNSRGGFIFIGIQSASKMIQGLKASKAELESMQRNIEARVLKFRPKFAEILDKVRFKLVPVVDEDGNFCSNLTVVRIDVQGPIMDDRGNPMTFKMESGIQFEKRLGFIVECG